MPTKARSTLFTEPTRHSLRLSRGRLLSYYTFPSSDSSRDGISFDVGRQLPPSKMLHPILYLHGFPGQGLELASAFCASQMGVLNCRLFAPDRPGVGYSDRLPENMTEDDRLKAVIDDLWEFIQYQGWNEFSVIGYSGGGPYALQFLSSYMEKKTKNGEHFIPKLTSMAIVAGLCCSAGVTGMMPNVQQMVQLSLTHDTSCTSRPIIDAIFLTVQFLLYASPVWFMKHFVPREFPTVDREIANDPKIMSFMIKSLKCSLRQGGRAESQDGYVAFHQNSAYEKVLRCRFSSCRLSEIPKISIHHGLLDAHVPLSHSQYIYETLLNRKAILYVYEDMGHLSLVVKRADIYTRAVSPMFKDN